MAKYRNYWVYTLGSFLVWTILLTVVSTTRGGEARHNIFLVFCGWVIAWVSTSIARYIYPPPKRWLEATAPTP
jgi:hypothetical protein